LSSSIGSSQRSDGLPSGPTTSARQSPALRFLSAKVSAPIACTTIYKAQKLPEIDVLKAYCTRFEQVDCTGRSNARTINFGYVRYNFDLYDTQSVTVKHYGHARKIDDGYLTNFNKLIPQKS
jgi:hypothetical protein